MVIAILIFVICAFIVFYLYKNKDKKHLNGIYKRYRKQVLALINATVIPDVLTKEAKRKILSLSEDDWKEWIDLIYKTNAIAKKYTLAFKDYIDIAFPNVYARNSYALRGKLFAKYEDKALAIIDSLTLDELRKINGEEEQNWINSTNIINKASDIVSQNKEGIKLYQQLSGKELVYSDIVHDENIIKRYQQSIESHNRYVEWEKKQSAYCDRYWQLIKDYRPNDGRYVYEVEYGRVAENGKKEKSKFKIWQGFVNSFSNHHIDLQTEYYKRNRQYIEEYKTKTRYYSNSVYDSIYEIIKELKNNQDNRILVVFITYSSFHFTEDAYKYHYSHFMNLLKNDSVEFCTLSELNSVTGEYSHVIIFDFITSNEEMKDNCRLVIDYFNDHLPLLGYYSIVKEYSEFEFLKILKEDSKKEDQEKSNILAYIKKLIESTLKHRFFAYIAITNTLIGEANGAKETKKIWLKQPDKYYLKLSSKTDNVISGSYSVDYGRTYIPFKRSGNRFDIDDVTKFTLDLFVKMGVIDEFKENGKNAIDYINHMGFLANH